MSATARGPAGDMVVSYAGLWRGGSMATLWHYVGDAPIVADEDAPGRIEETPWWRAAITLADTLVRA